MLSKSDFLNSDKPLLCSVCRREIKQNDVFLFVPPDYVLCGDCASSAVSNIDKSHDEVKRLLFINKLLIIGLILNNIIMSLIMLWMK